MHNAIFKYMEGILRSQTPSLSLTILAFQFVSLSVSSWSCPSFFHFLTVLFYVPSCFSLLQFALVSTHAHRKTSFREKAQIRDFKHSKACKVLPRVSTLSQIFQIRYMDEKTDIVKLLSVFCIVQHT